MPVVANQRLIVVGRDRRIRTKPSELLAFCEHGLRVFWIAGKKDLTNWDKLVLLGHRWGDIERIVRERGPGPWFMAINARDVMEIPLPREGAGGATSAA